MQQGMYNLTSQMISGQRNLNVIGHNITNISTPGHRADRLAITSFREEMMVRTGNLDKKNDVPIGNFYMATTMDEAITYFGEKGVFDNTGMPLDFALVSDGFFAIKDENSTRYTRNGSFIIDDDGYLALPSVGRVLDNNGEEILLNTDDIIGDSQGNIYNKDTNERLATIGVYNFDDYHAALRKDDTGLFVLREGQTAGNAENPEMLWQYVELSNTNMADEMVKMITAQRGIQASAQILKMYDGLTARMTNDLGRLS